MTLNILEATEVIDRLTTRIHGLIGTDYRDAAIDAASRAEAAAEATASHRDYVAGQVDAIDTAFTDSIPPYLQPDSPDGLNATYMQRGELHISPQDFGAVPLPNGNGGGTDSTDALIAMFKFAETARDISDGDISRKIVINAWYKFNRDIVIEEVNGLEIVGEGGNSGLLGVNAGLRIGSTTSILNRPALRNLRVKRVTTEGNSHGTALDIFGGGMSEAGYPVRWALDHVEVESPVHPRGLDPENSIALKLNGTFLATCTSLYLRNAHTGLVVEVDAVDRNLSANAVTFVGGEIQAVRHIGRIERAIGIAFYGMAWEGSSVGGMDVNNTQGLTVSGAYWEANANYDLRLGESSVVRGVAIHGGTSSRGALAGTAGGSTKRSIVVRRAMGVSVDGMHFGAYDLPPVYVNEAATNTVRGGLSNCSHSILGTPVEEVVSATIWNEPVQRRATFDGTGRAQTNLTVINDAGKRRGVEIQSGSSRRWFVGGTAEPERGDNSGSPYEFVAYNDDGSYAGMVMSLYRSNQTVRAWANLQVNGDLNHDGSAVGFYGTTPVSRPEVTGSRENGEAWSSLLSALVELGLVTDQTTP